MLGKERYIVILQEARNVVRRVTGMIPETKMIPSRTWRAPSRFPQYQLFPPYFVDFISSTLEDGKLGTIRRGRVLY